MPSVRFCVTHCTVACGCPDAQLFERTEAIVWCFTGAEFRIHARPSQRPAAGGAASVSGGRRRRRGGTCGAATAALRAWRRAWRLVLAGAVNRAVPLANLANTSVFGSYCPADYMYLWLLAQVVKLKPLVVHRLGPPGVRTKLPTRLPSLPCR